MQKELMSDYEVMCCRYIVDTKREEWRLTYVHSLLCNQQDIVQSKVFLIFFLDQRHLWKLI